MFDGMMETRPPRAEIEGKKLVFDALIGMLCEVTKDEDKPVIEALRNANKVMDLTQKMLDRVKDTLEAEDKAVPRERAIRVNAVFLPIIETLEQFLNENV